MRNKLQKRDLALDRYFRHRGGMSKEDIAAEDGVSVATIEGSLDLAEAYRRVCNMSELEATFIGTVMEHATGTSQAIKDGLNATKTVEYESGGKTRTKTVPDHETRLSTIRVMNEMVEKVRPKTPFQTTQVNLGVQTNVAVQAESGETRKRTRFETIVEKLHEKRQAQLSAPATIIEGKLPEKEPVLIHNDSSSSG